MSSGWLELLTLNLETMSKEKTKVQESTSPPLLIVDVSESVCVCKYPVRVAGDRLLEPYCGKCFKDFKQTVC